jgi:peptidoglycan hydrolase-like protein with peptidoglycan-binding domain
MGEELLSVPASELELQWEGEAWVIWDVAEGVPDVLIQGDAGSGVAWLQNALADLGYYGGAASGFFDGATRAGVVALQLDRDLNPDGVVGPRTQMILYALMESHEVPRLSGFDEDALPTLSGVGEDTLGALPGVGENFPAGYDDEAANEEVRFPRQDGPG